jgi:hypothetical protein
LRPRSSSASSPGQRPSALTLAAAVGDALAAVLSTETEASDELGVSFDPGHVLGPIGLQVLIGVVVGLLAERRS